MAQGLSVITGELERRRQELTSPAAGYRRVTAAIGKRALAVMDFNPRELFNDAGEPLPLMEIPDDLLKLCDFNIDNSGKLHILPPSQAVRIKMLELAAKAGYAAVQYEGQQEDTLAATSAPAPIEMTIEFVNPARQGDEDSAAAEGEIEAEVLEG